MSDFEYVRGPSGDDHEPYHHLTCCLCQTLAVMPVRIQHVSSVEDCGTVTCLECFQHWVASLAPNTSATVTCPRCRAPCTPPSNDKAVPDRLLGRLLGHLSARCTHCQQTARVEDLPGHWRTCHRRRLALLRKHHPAETASCPRLGECRGMVGCVWADVLSTQLLQAIRPEVEECLREWVTGATQAGDQYVYQYPFRTVAAHLPMLVTRFWLYAWTRTGVCL